MIRDLIITIQKINAHNFMLYILYLILWLPINKLRSKASWLNPVVFSPYFLVLLIQQKNTRASVLEYTYF